MLMTAPGARGTLWLSPLLRLFNTKKRTPKRPLWALPKDLSRHLAQDIGLTDDEYDQLQHRWPSQTHHGH